MQFPQVRPGMKLALAVYAGARLLDLVRGGRWNGSQREITALAQTLPPLVDTCDKLLVVANEMREVLAPTFTPVRSRRTNRRVRSRRPVMVRRQSKRGTIIPTRLT